MIYDIFCLSRFKYLCIYTGVCFTSLLPTCTGKMIHRNIKRLIKEKLSNNIIGRQWTCFPVK